MATTDMKEVFTMLFTAPAEASVEAERKYRRIWKEWLGDLSRMHEAFAMDAQQFSDHIDIAPVLSFEAAIEVGITMRIASVREMSGGIEAGLRLSVFEASGRFGFVNRTSTESVMQARAQYQMANREITLRDYLGSFGVPLAEPDDIEGALDFMTKEVEALDSNAQAPAPTS